ncbi:hypothetical protein ACLE20_14990 [Rhizobium sp. YIM 134829]|uniref:hypothetical protein n=1 Tax=Rhizobium sp. YIM 134829 TaxID=3390453 RepID=UPI00397A0586
MIDNYQLSVYRHGRLTRRPVSLSALDLRRVLLLANERNERQIDTILTCVDEGRCELCSADQDMVFIIERIFSS